ncbi:MAG: vWA domain-containing protein [Alkalilacustris sp.]
MTAPAPGTHSARASAALRRMGEDDPALGALALWCAHRDAEDGAPEEGALAWTDGRTIFYGPGFADLPAHEQVGAAAHQVLHVALRHPARAKALGARLGMGAQLYNLAADAIVNETLSQAGHALPRPAVLLSRLVAETLGDRDPAPLARWDAERLVLAMAARQGRDGDGEGKRKGESAEARAEAHAAEQGFRRDLRPDGDAQGGGAEEEVAAEWQGRLARALAAGRAAGRGIGALRTHLADIPRSDLPWEVLLRGLITRAVQRRPEQSFQRPAKRWIAAESDARRRGKPIPGFEPGMAPMPRAARLAVAIDCSTSIDNARLALFAGQIAGIGRRTGAEVHVLPFDTQVQDIRRMQGASWEDEIRKIPLARGGGTDFGPVLEAACALSPSAIVVLTDLDGPLGPAPGRVPVIWAVPGPPPRKPAFGRVVDLGR